jgi:small subunit ribosomal protein S5
VKQGLNSDKEMAEVKVVRSSETELKDRLVAVNRVTKVTKGGRTFGFAAIVVVGNENGIVGHGLGKSKEVAEAVTKAIEDAKKNLIKVPVHHGTIPHEHSGKFGGARVFIKPASHGTGVIAGGAMRAVLESAGVTDVLAKSKGSSNPHNVVKATLAALSGLRDPQEIARMRGVSLDKVFNG